MDSDTDAYAEPRETRRSKRRRNSKAVADGNKVYYPKKRVNIACQVCRQRKTKCDAVRPTCGFCIDIGATCVYRIDDSSDLPSLAGPAQKGNTSVSPCAVNHEEVISRLDRIEGLLQSHNPPTESCNFYSPLEQPGVSGHLPLNQSPETYQVPICPLPRSADVLTNNVLSIPGARPYDEVRPAELAPLADLGSPKGQLDFELFQSNGRIETQEAYSELQDLDLNPRLCWQLQQAFLKDVLPWCPMLDQQACSDLVSRTAEGGFRRQGHDTRLTFFILALGCVTIQCQDLQDDPTQFPGIAYFHAGCKQHTTQLTPQDMLLYIQGSLLEAFYLLHILRPVQGYDALRNASDKVLIMLSMRHYLDEDPTLREFIHRAYWACYLLEYELQHYVSHSSRVISKFHEDVPLPMSSYDEPGIYWFVAEIALRRIVARPLNGIYWNLSTTQYEPAIGVELSSQAESWFENLPRAVAFPLNNLEIGTSITMRMLLDPRTVFLRAQYYALQAAILWPNVVKLLWLPSINEVHTVTSTERARLVEATIRCIHFAVLHGYAVEPLLQSRHMFVTADITGINSMTLLLLSTYEAEKLRGAVPHHPQAAEAIQIGRRCLKLWEATPPVRRQIMKIDRLMEEKGISP